MTATTRTTGSHDPARRDFATRRATATVNVGKNRQEAHVAATPRHTRLD